MQDVTTPRVKDYLEHRMDRKAFEGHPGRPAEDRPVSAYTIHQLVRSFRTFGRWLTENGYDDPFVSLQPGKLPEHLIDVLSEAEITTLFGVYNPGTHHGARWQAILAFCLDTGVRVDELVNLELKRLDLEAMRAKVLGKGNKERWVRFGNRTQRALSRYLNLFRETESPYVFATLDGQVLSTNGMQNILKNVRKRSGLQRVHFHLFRHTFATNFLAQGGDSLELKELLGHTSLAMTQKYVHLSRVLGNTTSRRPSPLDALNVEITPRPKRGRPRLSEGPQPSVPSV
jgi:site-specific recombinase XerD